MAEAGKGPSVGTMSLILVTPKGEVARTKVTEIQAPGVVGEFGVLPGHIPFLSALASGVLSYGAGGQTHVLAVGPGFVEVGLGDAVTVLTETCAMPDQINLDEVTQEEQDAAQKLVELSPADDAAEYRHQEAVMSWARARREAVERQRALTSH